RRSGVQVDERRTTNDQRPTPDSAKEHSIAPPSLVVGRSSVVHLNALSPNTPPSRVPRPLMPLIGREREVAEVRERLRYGRLVSLIGGGGMGKTRLAMEVGARAEAEFPGGAVWVDFTPLADGALVLSSLAAALGLRESAAGDAETLEARLLARLS